MMSIFGESEKLRRFVAADRIESSPGFIRAISSEAEGGKKFAVKFHRPLKIFYPQINVVQNPRSHFLDFRFSRRIINFNPDQVSSIAQTLYRRSPAAGRPRG